MSNPKAFPITRQADDNDDALWCTVLRWKALQFNILLTTGTQRPSTEADVSRHPR